MGVLKNDVGRPTNKTIMIRRIFKIILGVLLVIGCYFVGYKLGSSMDKKEDGKDVVKTTDEEVIKITDAEVKDIYNKFNNFTDALDVINNVDSANYSPEFFFTYFFQDKLVNKDVKDEIKFAIAYNELYAKKVYNLEISEQSNFKIYLSELNKKSEALFGSKIDIDKILYMNTRINPNKKMVKVGIYGTAWSYNESDESFSLEGGGVGDCSGAHYASKITNIKRKVGKVEVISKPIFIYVDGCGSNGVGYKIFKTANKDTKYYNLDDEVVDLTGKVNFASTEEQQSLMQSQLETYSDKLDSYKWTFVQTEKGNFIFDSVEKITK